MKKALRVITALVLVFVLTCGSALACCSAGKGLLNSLKNKVSVAAVMNAVDVANTKIEKLVKVAQKTPFDDVDEMLFAVDIIVDGVFAYADMMGVEIACDYTYYVVDGRTVAVDPLRVINENHDGD